jgi:DNA-binding response OmpR family regulator
VVSTYENVNRRQAQGPDRRRFARGGRRATDRPGRHPKIAVIDRYDAVRSACARYLEHFNFDVVEAADLDSGLALLESARPAVVLLEEGGLSGFETLHQQTASLSIPCISLASALGEAQPPAGGLLVKPFTLGAMLEEIRRVLRLQMFTDAAASGPVLLPANPAR